MREKNLYYSTEGSEAYWGERWLKGADVDTFVVHDDRWAHDAHRVWEGGAHKRTADAATFEYLNVVYCRDSKQAHTASGLVSGADAATFEVLDSGYVVSEYRFATNLHIGGYARDSRRVYYQQDLDGRAHQVKGADAAQFVSFGNGYGRDQAAVYCHGIRIAEADPATWVFLGRGYSIDRQSVFYHAKRLDGVDPKNFAVCYLPTVARLATDGTRYFWTDRVISPSKFYEEVEGFQSSVGVIVERWWPGNATSSAKKIAEPRKTANTKSPTVGKKSPKKKAVKKKATKKAPKKKAPKKKTTTTTRKSQKR